MRIPQAELELSKSATVHNFKYFKSLLKPSTKILVLVKSNSYGHGGVEFARLALEAGADYLGIATLEEGVIMRKAGITAPILALSTGCDCYSDIIQYDLEPGIPSVEYLQKLTAVLKSMGIKHYPIHIVERNQSIFDVAQLYGIRLKNLYELNQLGPEYVPQVGDILRIR